MKYRFLAMLLAFLYLFSAISVSAVSTTASDTTNVTATDTQTSDTETTDTATEETAASESSTEDSSTEDTTGEDTTSQETDDSKELSTTQIPADKGCIIPAASGSGPSISASAAVLMDAASGSILYAKDADSKYYPASITKIVTTLVALENGVLSDSVFCDADTLYAIEQDSSRVGLEANEIITLEDALYFVMLASGNDAAAVVAEHVGGTIDTFVNMMNEKVTEIGCTNTHFTNPHGLHNEEHYTTARDMALIMQAAVSNEKFCKIASATNYTAPATNLNDARPTWNHHKMILPASEYHYDGVQEGKTGYTSIASGTLVTTAERDGIKLIAVVLRGSSTQNYYDTAKLFDYGFKNFSTLKPLEDFNLKEAAQAAGLSEENMEKLSRYNTVYNTDYFILAPANVTAEDISVTFTSEGPKDGIFGEIHIFYEGEEIGTLNVYYDVEEEYKIIANEDTEVTITSASKIPFFLVGTMALLLLLIILLAISIILHP